MGSKGCGRRGQVVVLLDEGMGEEGQRGGEEAEWREQEMAGGWVRWPAGGVGVRKGRGKA